MSMLTLENVTYRYDGGKKDVLRRVNAEFRAGTVHTIVGRSGSGKSTLLSLIAGLDVCRTGRIVVDGDDLGVIDRDAYRAGRIGVIFQAFNLVTNATAVQNVVLAMNIARSAVPDRRAHAYQLLESLGIDREAADRRVLRLSGGQQQRVAVARALAPDPKILVADEPTGNLDAETEEEILDIFTRLAREQGRCVVIVTHSREVTRIADVVHGMKAGQLDLVRDSGRIGNAPD